MRKSPSLKRTLSTAALTLLCITIALQAHYQNKRQYVETFLQQQAAPALQPTPSGGALELETRLSNHIGYAGATPLKIILSEDHKIISVSFLPNNETPAFIRRIERSGFMNSWNGLTAVEAINKRVDATSGATMTTQCVINTLRDDLTERVKSGELLSEGEILGASKGWYYYFKIFASLVVLAIALYSFFCPKKMNPFRLYLLALSVIVLGFWQGQHLSITNFINMLTNGVNWAVWFIPLLVLLAFALPLITGKSFYCMYLCPFGAAQELVSKLSQKRIEIPQKLYRVLTCLRPAFLLVIIVLLLLGIVTDFADFEPFTAFLLDVNLWIPMVIAGTFLLISLIIPKFWCKYCCPTGYMIDMVK